jgi:predicted outer membrane protein
MKRFHIGIALLLSVLLTLSGHAQQNRSQDTGTARSGDQQFLQQAIEMNSAEVQLSRLAQMKSQNQRVRSYADMMVGDHSQALDRLQAASGGAGRSTQNRNTQDTNRAATGTAGNSTATDNSRNQNAQSNQSNQGSQGSQNNQSGQGNQNQAQLSKQHEELAARLGRLSGADFDREYMQAMVNDHRQAITQFERQVGGNSLSSNSPSSDNVFGREKTRTGNTGGLTPDTGGSSTNNPAGTAQSDGRAAARDANNASSLARELLPTLRRHLQEAESIQRSLGSK